MKRNKMNVFNAYNIDAARKINLKTLGWMHFTLISAKISAMQLPLTLYVWRAMKLKHSLLNLALMVSTIAITQHKWDNPHCRDKTAMQYAWVLVGGAFKTWIKAHTCLCILRSHQREQLANFLLRLNQSDSLALEIHHNNISSAERLHGRRRRLHFQGLETFWTRTRAETTKLASQ
jgi:hypothetical protein